jgi:hypothetical protein
MSSPADLEERLRTAFSDVRVDEPRLDVIKRGGQRRRLRRIGASIVGAAVVVAVLGWSAVTLASLGRGAIKLADGTIVPRPVVAGRFDIPIDENSSVPMAVGLGAVWIADNAAGPGQVLRVDPDSGVVVARISLNYARPFDVAVGFGAVWVAGRTDLVRIDPVQNRISSRLHIFHAGGSVEAAFGSIWAREGTLLRRFDPQTLEVVAAMDLPRETQGLVVAGRFLWTAGRCAGPDNGLYRIDPLRNEVRKALDADGVAGLEGNCVYDVTAGNGSIWALSSVSGISINSDPPFPYLVMIDPDKGRVIGPLRQVKGDVNALTFSDGALWVLRHSRDEARTTDLLILDPGTGGFTGTALPVGLYAYQIVTGDGYIWVPSTGLVLSRIRP